MTRTTDRSGRRWGFAPSGLLPLLLLSFGCLAVGAGHAYAMTNQDALASAFSDGDTGFQEMSSDDMSAQRGGYDGVAFGIYLTGSVITTPGNQLPAGVQASVTGNQLQIIGGVGSFGNANGIFQFVNVVGNSNVINNNVIINVTVLPTSPGDSTFLH
jgi:hypothetical protein